MKNLHTHPMLERELKLDENHVIVDKRDLEYTQRYIAAFIVALVDFINFSENKTQKNVSEVLADLKEKR